MLKKNRENMMSYKNTNYSLFLILLQLTIIYTAHLAASDCLRNCGGVEIPFPFGIGKDCSLDKHYEIECRKTPTSRKRVPVLTSLELDVVSITPPDPRTDYRYGSFDSSSKRYGLVRVKIPTVSTGCRNEGKESGIMNLTGSPFFVDDQNSLVAVGCNSRVSLTQIKPNTVVCELNCNTKRDSHMINNIPFLKKTGCFVDIFPNTDPDETCSEEEAKEIDCDGNGCCRVELSEPQQVVGINITSNDEKSTSCRVAFLTDDVYDLSSSAKPKELFHKRDATTVTLGWVIQTNKTWFLKSLNCKFGKDESSSTTYSEPNCTCGKSIISGTTYANCECNKGYKGNPYAKECEDINECKDIPEICGKGGTCENTIGSFRCGGDKTKAIVIGVSASFCILALVGGAWGLRKLYIKRMITNRKKKYFKRNGGLLLQQKLNTREGNVETTKIFSSRELEKATENFSETRVLGQGGQGTVYKGMLVDGSTVAVKKSKVVDEDKLQEFINEVVILSQINHRHVVKLLGCCLETEVPTLVYEFIINGNLFKHIQEESDEYTMIWGMRLRVAVDVAGALSYLHSFASSPIYHRDIKSANILLDEKHRAKVADFGTSRSITIDQTHWTTIVSGTVGYVDPEYYRSSQYTDKSDVYSFGVILAELITGDKPVLMVQNTQEIVSLAEHFKVAMKEKRLSDIIDARIKDDCKPEQVSAVANLALKCLSSKGKKRPNMREVFMELERICTSPEDSKVQQIHIDEEDEEEEEEEEEVRNMINKRDSCSVSMTAPAFSIDASPSSSDVEPLFPRLTW